MEPVIVSFGRTFPAFRIVVCEHEKAPHDATLIDRISADRGLGFRHETTLLSPGILFIRTARPREMAKISSEFRGTDIMAG